MSSRFVRLTGLHEVRMRSLVFLLVALADVTPCQRLPEKDDTFTFNIPSDVLFHDTKVLPEGREVVIYLPRNETKRFFFVVERGKKPIYFALTPCSSPLDWKIFFRYQNFQNGNTGNLDDPLSQQRDLLRRPKRSKRLLQSLSGSEMMTFLSRHFRSGLFILEVSSSDGQAATARLFASSSESEMSYPEVVSPRVDVIQKGQEGVTIAWKGSISEAKWGTPVEYCVTYNTRKSFRSMCAVESDRHGVATPPSVPQFAGFGFQWEKRSARTRDRNRNKATEVPPTTPSSEVLHLECVGRRTWHTLSDLLPGTPYFVDVFAINPATNRSTAYKAMMLENDGFGDPVILPEREIVYVSLRHRQGSTATFEYSPGAKCHQIVLAILPCFGQLSVEVRRGSELISDNVVKHLKKIRAYNVSAEEVFRIQVTGDGKQTQSLKVLATRRPKRDPFPEMKDDVRLSTVDKSTTCNAIVLRWPAPDEKSLYCLYKRKDVGSTKRLFTKQEWCNAGDIPKRNEKLFCRRYRRGNRQRSKFHVTETVSNLHPGTRYLFELQVTRRKGETLTYDPAFATTNDRC